jgi:hypothetical protein
MKYNIIIFKIYIYILMDSITAEMNKYSVPSGNLVSSPKDFLESNSLVAKISFLLLVVFLFSIVLQICISVLMWSLGPNQSPILINGMVDAKQMLIFKQDPSSSNSKTIMRSVNDDDGIAFTWSVWINIDDLTYLKGQYKHIFHKGNDEIGDRGLIMPNNAPGLYIAPFSNSLVVLMNTFNNINEEILIDNIPLRKWVNVIIRCENSTLDIYINGAVSKSVLLNGVPKQNYGYVYACMNGGFSGNISELRYYNKALTIREIQNINKQGANNKFTGTSSLDIIKPNYLSLRWYFTGDNTMDAFNP